MTFSEHTSVFDQREINVAAVLQVVWRRKYVVVVTAALSAAIAVYLALTAVPIYRAEVVITEVHDAGISGGGALAGQLGGFASLAGINLAGGGQDRERAAVLLSRRLVEEFIKREGIQSLLSQGSAQQQSLWFAVQEFRRSVLEVTEDKIKGITVVRIDWTDPVIAARWANHFAALANDLLRNRALDDANRNIAYLDKQIARTNVVELQRVMYNLVESETKTLMLANAREEYAFTVVDPAVPPEKRISPRRTLMVATGLIVGIVLGALLALLYDRLAARRFRPRQA